MNFIWFSCNGSLLVFNFIYFDLFPLSCCQIGFVCLCSFVNEPTLRLILCIVPLISISLDFSLILIISSYLMCLVWLQVSPELWGASLAIYWIFLMFINIILSHYKLFPEASEIIYLFKAYFSKQNNYLKERSNRKW